MSRAVDSTARAMAGEALSRLDNGSSGSGGTTVDAYSKLETDNLLNAKVDDVEFTPIKALAESNEINITYLANNKAEKTEVNTLSELVADIDSEVDLKANKADVYTKAETNTAISDKVAEIVANAPEDFDTLKELADWIDSHEDSASAMNTAIKQNTSDIANLKATDETTATEIASIKNNVAINRTTLGIECKNLCPVNSASVPDGGGYFIGIYNNHYPFYLKQGRYTISCKYNTDVGGSAFHFYDKSETLIKKYEFSHKSNIEIEVELDRDAYYMLGYCNSVAEISDIMLRYADIIDDTYEPYQPSLQEQVTALTERIVALESALTTATTQEA